MKIPLLVGVRKRLRSSLPNVKRWIAKIDHHPLDLGVIKQVIFDHLEQGIYRVNAIDGNKSWSIYPDE